MTKRELLSISIDRESPVSETVELGDFVVINAQMKPGTSKLKLMPLENGNMKFVPDVGREDCVAVAKGLRELADLVQYGWENVLDGMKARVVLEVDGGVKSSGLHENIGDQSPMGSHI